MIRTMLRMVPLGLVLAVSAAAAAGCGGIEQAGALRPLTIGAVLSRTGAGNAIGPQQIAGARLAVAEINRTGGVDGAPLRLIIRDDRTEPAQAMAEMRNLVGSSHVLALLGPSLSIVALAADPVAERLRTPVLAISNTAAGIVGHCGYPCSFIWRVSLGESVAVPANVESYTDTTHARSAVIVYTSPDTLGAQEASEASARFRVNGVPAVHRIRIPAEPKNLAPYIRRALAAKPSVLFVGGSYTSTLADVIKTVRARGFTGAILGGTALNADTAARLAGRAGAGVQTATAWSQDNAFPDNVAFMNAYQQRYGTAPDEKAAQAYTGILVLARAMRRAKLAGSTQDVPKQRALLQDALSRVALTTPLGPFRFTREHDVTQIVWIRRLDGHGGNRLTGFCNPEC